MDNDSIDLISSSNCTKQSIEIKIITKDITLPFDQFKLKRQTHLHCKKCSACQSAYNKLLCDECGTQMSEENKIYN